jgi:hypothetical protein
VAHPNQKRKDRAPGKDYAAFSRNKTMQTLPARKLACTQTYTAEFAAGSRAKLTVCEAGIDVEWIPAVPQLEGESWRRFVAAYRTWRNESLKDYANRTGITIAVVDL